MSRLDVTSREYNVMLLPEPFAGDEDDIRRIGEQFWADVRAALEPLDIPTEGTFDEVKARRRIRFLDSADAVFDGQRYVFRERIGDAETKFEEDVKPPFVSAFSYSTTIEVDADADVSRLRVARDAHDVLKALHDQLTDWVHPEPNTKTALVYG